MTPDGKNVLFGAYAQGDNPDPSKVYEVDGTTMASVTEYDFPTGLYTDTVASSPHNCDVYVSDYYSVTNILNYTCNESDATALAQTGTNSGVLGSLAVFGLLVASAGAVLLARRRHATK